MAVKEIISVEVEDEAFKTFAKLFEQYHEQVKELPGEWSKVDEAIGSAGQSFAKSSGDTQALLAGMAASAGSIVSALHKAQHEQHHFAAATNRSHSAMTKLGSATKAVGSTVFGLAKGMLKLGALGLGLGAAASGFGLFDLANSALSRQRTARGLGMSPGQNAALTTYFGQFGNADGVASGVANARNDVRKRQYLLDMGFTNSQLQNDSSFQLTTSAFQKEQRFVKSLPRASYLAIADAYGAQSIGFDNETIRRLRHSSTLRVDTAAMDAQRNVGSLGFSKGVAAEWSSFAIELKKAGVEIESSLIVALHRLAPELKIITGRVANWIDAFARGPDMKIVMRDVSGGLADMVKFLGSPTFHHDLQTFAAAISQLAKETVDALRYFHMIPQKSVGVSALAASQTKPDQKMSWQERVTRFVSPDHSGYTPQDIRNMTNAANAHYKLPAHFLTRQAWVESNFNSSAIGPKTKYGRAVGVTQMLAATAREYKVHNRFLPGQEIPASAKMDAELAKYYNGDYRKVAAAYNWGIGNVDADIAWQGTDWLKYAPQQTQVYVQDLAGSRGPLMDKYINKVTHSPNRTAAPASVVTIHNKSGMRIWVNARGAHH